MEIKGLKIAMYGAGIHSLELSKIVNFQSSIEFLLMEIKENMERDFLEYRSPSKAFID